MSEKEFVTVVAVEAGSGTGPVVPEEPRSPSGFVTVVSVGADLPEEEVLVYRLPGERLGFGLKFEGGVKTAETVRRLFIQSCAIDSPASRAETTWGGLREGDEVIAIDGAPVNEMTRLACVHRLKDSPVVLKLLVVHHPLPEPSTSPPLVVSETVKQPPPPPPPIPPRKKQHKEQPPPPPRGFEDQSKTKKTFAFDIATVPPEAEVYLDLIRQEEQNRLNGESESDDTGSSISTVVDRGLPSSVSTTCNSSLDSLNIDIAKVLGPFEKLERELDEDEPSAMTTSSSSNSLQPPLSFQDAPLSYGDEKMPQLIGDAEVEEEEAPALPPKPMPRKEMNNNCVKVCKQRAPTPTEDLEEQYEIEDRIEHQLTNGVEVELDEEQPVDDDEEEIDDDDDEDMFPEWAMNDLKLPNGPEDTEFKVTSVLSSEASFFPFHWGVSSHLATIGEDEEEDEEQFEELEQETTEEQKTSYGPEISLQLENRVRPSSPPPPPPPLLHHTTSQQQTSPPITTKDLIEQPPQINGELIIDNEEIQVPLEEDIIQEDEEEELKETRNIMVEINNHHNSQQQQQQQQPQDFILNEETSSSVLSSSVPTIETSPPSISSEAISGVDVLSTSPAGASTMKPPGLSPGSSVLRSNPPPSIGGDSLHRRQPPHSQHTTHTPIMLRSSSTGSYMQSTISDDDDDDKSVRQAMETLLALEKLTTGHKTTPLSSSTVYSKLSPLVPPSIPPPQPPPSFSRLPPDGHEFPPNYHESYAFEMNPTMSVRNNNNNTSSQSLDDLDVLKSLPPPPPPPSAPPPAPRRSAIELSHQPVTIPSNPRWGPDVISGSSVRDKIAMFSNSQPAPPPRPSTKSFRPPDIEVPTPASRKKPPASSISSQQLHDISYMDLMRTQSQIDLASVSGYHSSASTDSSLSSSGYATLPRKPPATPTTAPPTLSRTISFSDQFNPRPLHTRSQSLVDINNSNPNARRTSLNSILDQRRKSMSKLKGLVIPERVAEVVAAATPLPDLPEITPKLPTISKYDTNSLQRTTTSTFTNKPLWATTTLATPLWKAAPIPEYSPAFKRKPLTIYDKRPPTTLPPPPPTTAPPSFTISKEVHEDSDDNDSAVSSSRSSISPPPSPIPTTTGTGTSAADRRVLKPYTVEAINRKNVLSSARHSSGKDDKIGSPLIQRKFEEEQQQLQQLQQSQLAENNNNNKNINNSTSQPQIINYRIPSSQQLTTSADIKIAYLDTLDASEDIFSSIEEIRPISPVIHTRVLVKSPPPNEIIEKQQQQHQQQQTNDNTKTSSPPPVMTKPNKLAEDRLAALKKKYDLDQMVDEEEEELEEEEDDVDDIQAVNASEDDEEELEQVETPVDDDDDDDELEEDEDDDMKSSSTTATVIPKETPIEEIKEAKVQENAVAQLKAVLQQGPSTTASMLPRSRLRLRLNSNTSIEKSPTSGGTSPITPMSSPLSPSKIPAPRVPVSNRRSASVTDIRKAFEYKTSNNLPSPTTTTTTIIQRQPHTGHHVRVSSLDSTTSEDSNMVVSGSGVPQPFGSANNLHREQFGSITSLASSTSLISQQELQSLIDEANQTLEEASCLSPEHEVVVVILHRELATGSVGITLAGGADYESKEITVHKVLAGSPADRDGRIQKGDRIISINGRSMKGLTHKDSLNILKTPRTEVVLVVSRPRTCIENTNGITTTTTTTANTTTTINTNGDVLTPPRTPSGRPPKILEQVLETNSTVDCTDSLARGPPKSIILIKDGAGLGFSLEGGKDSPLGDRPLTVKKIFTGGVAYKNGELKAGAELLKINGVDLTPMSRIEAWSMLKKLPDGPVTLTLRPPVEN